MPTFVEPVLLVVEADSRAEADDAIYNFRHAIIDASHKGKKVPLMYWDTRIGSGGGYHYPAPIDISISDLEEMLESDEGEQFEHIMDKVFGRGGTAKVAEPIDFTGPDFGWED